MTENDPRLEEINTIISIFGEDVTYKDIKKDMKTIYYVTFRFVNGVEIVVSLPETYPNSSPPMLLRSKLKISSEIIDSMEQKLILLYNDLKDIVLFEWFQWAKDTFFSNSTSVAAVADPPKVETQSEDLVPELPTRQFPMEIFCSEPLVDRKSKFIAFAAHAESLEDVEYFQALLKSNKNIKIATHNVMAWRVTSPKSDSYDDDGEHSAGGVLLFLLQQRQIENVVLMVSRWFGGILLGSDRFKDFCTAANDVLKIGGFLENEKGNGNKKGKKEKVHTGRDRKSVV